MNRNLNSTAYAILWSYFIWLLLLSITIFHPSACRAFDALNIKVTGQTGGSTVAACWHGSYLYFGIGPRIGMIDATKAAEPILAGQTGPFAGFIASLYMDGNLLFAGAGEGGMIILNISDPLNPVPVSTVSEKFTYITSIAKYGNFCFLAAGSNGVLIYDVTDITSPVKTGSVTTDNESISVTTDGQLLFIADSEGGVRILDITEPASPQELSTVATPGSTKYMKAASGFLYIADWTSGIRIIDISSPAAPRKVSALDTDGYAQWITPCPNYAYIADGPGGVKIMDISNPSSPELVTTIPASAGNVPANITCVACSPALTAVARGDMGISLYDTSSPETPVKLLAYSPPGFPQDVQVHGDTAYIACDSQGLWNIDISSPSNPRIISSTAADSGNLSVELTDNFAILSNGYGGISIMDISDPALPFELSTFDTDGFSWATAVNGTTLYVADGDNGVRIIDASTPKSPIETGFLLTPQAALNVDVAGNYAYIAAVDAGLIIADVSKPTQPFILSKIDTVGPALGVTVKNNMAYVSAGKAGLRIIDISSPATPVEKGHFTLAGSFTFNADVEDTLACIANGEKGVSIIDISNPAQPHETAYFNSSGNAWRVRWDNGRVLLADEGGGLYLLELTETMLSQPSQITITANDMGPDLEWSISGDGTSPVLYRYATDSREVKILTSAINNDTSFIDQDISTDFAYLYWTHDRNSTNQDSYKVGFVPSSHLGEFYPRDFRLSSNRLDVASLSWEPVHDNTILSMLWILRLDGSRPEMVPVKTGENSISDVTGGVAACYSLMTLKNFSFSITDFLCLFPY